MKKVSVIIPIYNEEKNIRQLLKRLDTACRTADIEYEAIFVDDRSNDNTKSVINLLKYHYPARHHIKIGEQGKAFSLIEGFEKAQFEIIAMIDGDLQYPPEAIPQMIEKLNTADVIVANRKEQQTSFVRKLASRGFMYIFGTLLHKLPYDIQSGLKVFKKEILSHVKLSPTPWTFDMEFLVKSRELGYKIDKVDIVYYKREHGTSNIKLFSSIWEIGSSAVKLKVKDKEVKITKLENNQIEMSHEGSSFKPYTSLSIRKSAFFSINNKQKIYIVLALFFICLSLILNWRSTIITAVAILTVLYFIDLLFNVFVILKSFKSSNKINSIIDHNSIDWPQYTIFCPLYKEWHILPQFIDSMNKLDYPKEKLQIMLLLEQNDTVTQQKVKELSLPYYFQVVVVPHSNPKTKPKACNYGLQYATGKYTVIYDAEDIPDPDQLKKAVVAFQTEEEKVACIQARLNFYNPHQNILTRLFTAEYTLWFDLVLQGLQKIQAPIPLGGTSNHFKTNILKKLKGWDAFNVTEDCDLGIRLVKDGYKTAMFDSTTLEEANSDVWNWYRQRSRWIKGYMQTYLVHLRDVKKLSKKKNHFNVLAFHIIVGGKILSMFINPLMWVITISYFLFRPFIGEFIDSFFPTSILYMGVISLLFGNFIYLYNYMIGCARRGNYNLIHMAFLVPFYWIMMSFAAWKATYSLIREPFYWEKTKHGLHFKNQPYAINYV